MRLRLNAEEIGEILGLMGNVDWGAHFGDAATEKEADRAYAVAERAQAKLERRLQFLADQEARRQAAKR